MNLFPTLEKFCISMGRVPYNHRDKLHMEYTSETESEEDTHVVCYQEEIDCQLSFVDDQLHVAVNVSVCICKEEEVDISTIL